MSPEEINSAINRDIAEDAWLRQKNSPVAYRGCRRAEGLEKALFMCPKCLKIGGLFTNDDTIYCTCGFQARYLETGFFDPPQPFESIAQWDEWQFRRLRGNDFSESENETLFSDEAVTLAKITASHEEITLGEKVPLSQYADRLECGQVRMPLGEVTNMAMVRAKLLLLTWRNEYYQIRPVGSVSLRKYLAFWQERRFLFPKENPPDAARRQNV